MSLGDGVSQLVIEKRPKFDWQRNARFAFLGVCFVVSWSLYLKSSLSLSLMRSHLNFFYSSLGPSAI